MDIAIMIEGQNGLTWPRWQRLARAVEDLGFAGLYRSDHFTNANPPDIESLELWVSLTWLASSTKRIEFGPLVTPFSFRHPAMTARMAAAVDDLSGGRLVLGLGAGWQDREHRNFGFDLLDLRGRFRRFDEGIQIVMRLLRDPNPVTFAGRHYHMQDAVVLPRPNRPGGPPILIGGNGANRTLGLTARYGDVWNAVSVPPSRFAALSQSLTEKVQKAGRDPRRIRRTLMTPVAFGRTNPELATALRGRDPDQLQARGGVVGTPSAVVDQLGAFAAAGVECVMLQWLDLDALDRLEGLAKVLKV
jgi:F420-dependent oxidoreductase-like protein